MGGDFFDRPNSYSVDFICRNSCRLTCRHFTASRLSNYRIEQLEKKVDKHNNLVERVYLIEQHEAVNDNKIRTAEHRVADLENEQNKERKI